MNYETTTKTGKDFIVKGLAFAFAMIAVTVSTGEVLTARLQSSDDIHEAVVYFYNDKDSLEIFWGRGTGVVVRKFDDGSCWILTAAHVVTKGGVIGGPMDEECLSMFVKFTDGSVHEVEYVKHGNSDEDLALYRCSVCPVNPVTIADRDVRPGEKLYLQGAPHRPEGTRNFEFESNVMTWKDEVFGNGDCWTGESGTAILNSDRELVSILTGGWRQVRKQDGSYHYRTHPKNPLSGSVKVYPILGMSNTEVIRDFLTTVSSPVKEAKFTEYSGQTFKNDGSRRMVLLSAEWCGPCQVLKSMVKDSLADFGAAGIDEIIYVDCDKYPVAKTYFKVKVFPTIIIIDEGAIQKRREGSGGKDILIMWVKK